MIKGLTQEGDIMLINIYEPNTGAPKYIKQILINIKGEIDNNTIIARGLNTLLTSMDRSSRQKISKAMVVLNDTTDHLDLIDNYRTFYPKQQNTHSFQVHMECSLG